MMASLPVLAKTLVVFFLVLALNRARLKLSYCLFVGAVVLGLWSGMGPVPLGKSLVRNLLRFETVHLVLIVGLILVMSRLMKDSGQMDRIVSRFSGLTGDPRTVAAVMPALIGLLPMPGGALFSAPMVETAFCRASLSNEKKTVVNYWFRHVWEYWWPLYPGVVLAVGLLKAEILAFIAVMFPMTLVTALAGVVFILGPLKIRCEPREGAPSPGALRAFLREVMPIIVVVGVIAVTALFTTLLRTWELDLKLPGGAAILPGLLAALVWVSWSNRIPAGRIWAAVTDREIAPMVMLVAAIMLFKGVMSDSQAVLHIRDELVAYHFPLLLVILLMPFLSGFITGIAIGFVGASFPLIIPLFPSGSGLEYLAYACVAYAFGYMGMMLSPVHLCFLVTKDYFRASLFHSYRPLVLPVLTVLLCAWVYFLLLVKWAPTFLG